MTEIAIDEPDATIVTDFAYDQQTLNKNLGSFVMMLQSPDQK